MCNVLILWLRLSIVIVVLAPLLFCVKAQAHNRSQSFSSWVIDGDVIKVVFTVKAREITRLPPLEGKTNSLNNLLISHLKNSLSVGSGGQSCQGLRTPISLPAATGFVRAAWTFNCNSEGSRTLQIDSFFPIASSHVHYAQGAYGKEMPDQYLFTDHQRSHGVRRFSSHIETFNHAFMQYAELGVKHIFSGLDHIVFLLAIMLVFRNFREVIWMVSGFTIGHSITLSLAVLGWVEPDIVLVEALIGFTIALVAVENIGAITQENRKLGYSIATVLAILGLISVAWGRGLPILTIFGLIVFTLAYFSLSHSRQSSTRIRPFLTLVFGLIHGFGFAGILSEVGLPEQRFLSALVGFNVGVELGQLIIVVMFWYLVKYARVIASVRDFGMFVPIASSLLIGLGSYWFVARGFSTP
jgi:hypothetical protein